MNQSTMQGGSTIAQMLAAHPQQSWVEPRKLSPLVQSLNECAATCTICADACLAEQMVSDLVQCIRLNQDCADICAATARILMRSDSNPQHSMLRHMVEACAAACQACGQECTRHAQMHEHCRICAESCRHCEEACRQVLSAM
ncbi:MAG: four-helix bundle copper-binding protein [Caldilineaceae bacterium]